MKKINDTQSGLGYLLRIAAIHLCNCDCIFCHPPKGIAERALTTPQLLKIIKTINDNYQLKTIHFTGGDPLLRTDIVDLVEGCKEITGGLIEMAMTTNGLLLSNCVNELAKAGLSRINFSLHSLDPVKYQKLTNRPGDIKALQETIKKAKLLGLKVKVNSIVIRGINDMDMGTIASYCFNEGIIPRFLELGLYGPVSNWFSKNDHVSHDEILKNMQELFGSFELDTSRRGNGPTKYYVNSKKQLFGIINNQSSNLCVGCDRFRLSSTGLLKACDFPYIDLKEFLHSNDLLESEILKLRDILKTKGKDYIGKKTRKMDYNFRWNLT